MTLTIRKASENDDAVIAAFGRKTFETAFGSENDPDDMQSYLEDAFSEAQIARELKTPGTTFLLAYNRSHLKKKVLVEVHGGPELQPAGILQHSEELKQGANTEIGPKNYCEIASNETLVGYAKLEKSLPPACIRESNAMELGRLYVTAHHMGKGIGSQLIQACVDEASRQGYKTVWLGVWKRNFRAQALYERLGFVRVGTKTFVLGADVQQDLVYAKPL